MSGMQESGVVRMTREEAIKELTELLPEEFLMEYAESIRMAIKALEQEPCEDCVNRQAAINAIGNVPDHDDGMVFEALSHAQRNVALLPPVTPQIKIENAPLSMIKSIREKEDNNGHC